MDTEITFSYKDGYHDDIKTTHLTVDRSLFKTYLGSYDRSESSKYMADKLKNCGLIIRGHDRCINFLDQLVEVWMLNNIADSYEERFQELHKFLLKQELVQIFFEMY